MSASLITFYSFKGGVGRTQALANVAVALARKGKHVVVVDMDLESPGLYRFFVPELGRAWTDEELAGSERRGVIEYFEEAIKLPDDEPRLSFLPCAHAQIEAGRGSIRMVLPGRLDGTYPERMARLSFDELYRSFDGYDLVEAFRRQLVEADADFVLVDSRTGMTDVAGVCTFQLPDVVVALFALHRQGIDGVHQVAQAIERARKLAEDGRKRELLLVPARVDETGEIEKRDEWVRAAQLRMRDIDATLLDELHHRIPYEPRVAFGEEIVVGLAPSHLSEAYEHLTEKIRSAAGHEAPQEERALLSASLKLTTEAAWHIERHASELIRIAGQLGRELQVIHDELTPSLDELGKPLPEKLGSRIDVPEGWHALAHEAERLVGEAWEIWRQGWRERFRAQIEAAAEGESELVEPVLDQLDAALKRGELEQARQLCETHATDLQQATSRTALLRRDRLTVERLSRSLPDSDRRIQWLEDELDGAIDAAFGEDPETTAAVIRNCLRLLLTERSSDDAGAAGMAHEPTLWPAYDVLCAQTAGLAHESEFAAIGATLWRAAWRSYFAQDPPLPPDEVLPTGKHVRAQLHGLADQRALLVRLIGDIGAGMRRAWNTWGADRQSQFATLFRSRQDDPALRAAVMELPAQLDAVDARAIFALWLVHGGFDAGIMACYASALLREGRWPEAFFACEAARRQADETPLEVRALVALRFAIQASQRCRWDLVRELWLQPETRTALEHTRPGLLLVVLLATDLLPPARIAADLRQELGRHVLHESMSTLPAPLTEWLRWLERHPYWDGSLARRWAALKQQLDQVVEAFPTHNRWSPSLTIKEQFRAYWEGRYGAVADPNSSDAVKSMAAEDWLKHAVRKAASRGTDNTDPHGTLRTSMLEKFGTAERILADLEELSARDPAMVSSLATGEALRREAEKVLVTELQEMDGDDASALLALHGGFASNTGETVSEQSLTPAGAQELATLPLLLVRFDGPAPWQRYRDDLLQWSIGARDWAATARDYIQSGRFSEAARAIRKMASGLEETQAREQLERAWQQWRTDLVQRIAQVESEAAQMQAQQGDTAMLEDARAHARAVANTLQPYDDAWAGGTGLPALANAPEHAISDCKRRLDEAEVALSLTQEEIQQRRQRMLVLLRDLKQQIDAIATDLMLDAEHGERADEWTRYANQLLRAQDAAGLERLLFELRRLQAGEITRIDVPAVPVPPAAQPAPPVLRPRDVSQQPALSFLAQDLLMVTPPREPEGEPALHLDDFYPGREWSRGKLDAIIARCLRSLHPMSSVERYGRQEMGCLLVAQAQVHLLAGEFLAARALFGDALGWVTWRRREQAMRELSVRLWHEPCAWGFTLAFLLPYLGGQERARILTRANLGALFLQPFSELPLEIIARHEILGAYARQMHMLDAEAGVELLRYFVLPYLREHPIAEQDFAAGLLGGQGEPAALSRYLEVLLQPVVPDAAERLGGLVRELPEASRRERRTAMFLITLRAWLGEYEQSSGLAQALVDAAEQAGGEPGRPAADAEALITSSLMTRELVLAAGVPARLVLAVTGQDGIAPLYELRADVALLDENERQISGALDTPPLVDRLRAGERREIPVPVVIDPADGHRARRVQVRYSTASSQGQWQYLKTAHQSHALAIQPSAAEAERDIPMPYLVGRPVDRRDDIYGRDDKVDEIFTYLQGREQDNAVLVLGDRRIGKTTLLHAVKEDPRRRRYPLCVKIDQQDLDHRPQIFFGRLIREIQAELTAHDRPRHAYERREIDRDPAYAFRSFMAAVDRDLAARGLRMLVILDELEKVYKLVFRRDLPETQRMPAEVIASLRSVIQDSRRISFLLAGVTDGVRPYLETPEGRLFQMAHTVELEPLDRKAARALIERPAAQHYEVAAPASEHLVSQTGGQPYLLQRIGAELFRHMRRRRAKLVSVVDVDEVLEQRILPDTAFFSYLITPWRERERFSLLKALAYLQSGTRYVAAPDIARRLVTMGVLWDQEQVMAELDTLCKQVHTVLRRFQKRFRLEVGLLARHIRWLDRPGLDLVLRP